MQYRKFSANNIFTGYEMLGENEVLITAGSGKIIDIINKKDAGEEVEKMNGILCPGFINAHCHLELSHMKNCIPQHTGLIDLC